MPEKRDQLIGNEKAVQEMSVWFESFSPSSKALLLHGPCGCGKTVITHVLAKEYGFTSLLEWSANEERNRQALEKYVAEATQSYSMKSMFAHTTQHKTKPNKALLLFDELDGNFFDTSSDEEGYSAMCSIIQKSKIPVICICNDVYNPKLKSLKQLCQCVAFKSLTPSQLLPLASLINEHYSIGLTKKQLETNIVSTEQCKGDFRQMFFLLEQAWMDQTYLKHLDVRDSPTSSHNIFTAASHLFHSFLTFRSPQRLEQALETLKDFSSSDLGLEQVMLQEAMPHAVDSLDQLNTVFDLFSEADAFPFAKVLTSQEEDLWEWSQCWMSVLRPLMGLIPARPIPFSYRSMFGKITFPHQHLALSSLSTFSPKQLDPHVKLSRSFKLFPLTREHKYSICSYLTQVCSTVDDFMSFCQEYQLTVSVFEHLVTHQIYVEPGTKEHTQRLAKWKKEAKKYILEEDITKGQVELLRVTKKRPSSEKALETSNASSLDPKVVQIFESLFVTKKGKSAPPLKPQKNKQSKLQDFF